MRSINAFDNVFIFEQFPFPDSISLLSKVNIGAYVGMSAKNYEINTFAHGILKTSILSRFPAKVLI